MNDSSSRWSRLPPEDVRSDRPIWGWVRLYVPPGTHRKDMQFYRRSWLYQDIFWVLNFARESYLIRRQRRKDRQRMFPISLGKFCWKSKPSEPRGRYTWQHLVQTTLMLLLAWDYRNLGVIGSLVESVTDSRWWHLSFPRYNPKSVNATKLLYLHLEAWCHE